MSFCQHTIYCINVVWHIKNLTLVANSVNATCMPICESRKTLGKSPSKRLASNDKTKQKTTGVFIIAVILRLFLFTL